jgi:hypothetical protein
MTSVEISEKERFYTQKWFIDALETIDKENENILKLNLELMKTKDINCFYKKNKISRQKQIIINKYRRVLKNRIYSATHRFKANPNKKVCESKIQSIYTREWFINELNSIDCENENIFNLNLESINAVEIKDFYKNNNISKRKQNIIDKYMRTLESRIRMRRHRYKINRLNRRERIRERIYTESECEQIVQSPVQSPFEINNNVFDNYDIFSDILHFERTGELAALAPLRGFCPLHAPLRCPKLI